jgi:PHD/YefM family antitoxin component YafN of YafNO toxin-antitoxin module
MNYLAAGQLVSISDLQRNYVSLVQRAKKFAPLLLLRRNQPEVVLISITAYESLLEKSRLYEEKLALEAITDFEKEKKAGKLLVGKTGADLFTFEKKLT